MAIAESVACSIYMLSTALVPLPHHGDRAPLQQVQAMPVSNACLLRACADAAS